MSQIFFCLEESSLDETRLDLSESILLIFKLCLLSGYPETCRQAGVSTSGKLAVFWRSISLPF